MLTYSCPVGQENPIETKEELMEFLKGKSHAQSNVTAAVVSKEQHANGTTHYHACLKYEPKLNVRDASKMFDFKGVHPNIATQETTLTSTSGSNANWKRMIKYVTKDNDYITFNCDVTSETGGKKQAKDDIHREAHEMAFKGDIDGAKNLLRLKDSAHWSYNYGQINAALEASFKSGMASRTPQEIKTTRWKEEYENIDINAFVNDEDYHRVHILVGTAGIGKTQLAKYLLQRAGCKNIVVVHSAEQLKQYDGHYDGFVFDELNANAIDVRGGKWTREAQIGLVDTAEERAIPARYNDVVIRKGTKRIITTNFIDRAINIQDEAIARRVTVHDLENNKLYN